MIYFRSLNTAFLTTVLSTYSMGMENKPQELKINNTSFTRTINYFESIKLKWFSALSQGNLEDIKCLYKTTPELLTLKNEMGNNALIIAAYNRSPEIVKFLSLQNKDILTEKCNYGNNPLHIAAYNGQLDLVKFLYEQNSGLLAEKDAEGSNALLVAIINMHFDVANFLYEKNKNLLMGINMDGHGILHIAAGNGQIEVIKFLIQICPELLNQKCNKGHLPFIYAQLKKHKEIAIYMVTERLKLTQKTIPHTKVSIVEVANTNAPKILAPQQTGIQNKEIKVTVTESQKKEWFSTVSQGNLENIEFLYKRNPNLLMTKHKHGGNGLHLAAGEGNLKVVKFLCHKNEALLTEKAMNDTNVLHLAARMGHLEVVKWLYEQKKTLLTDKTQDGGNALNVAEYGGQLEVVKWIYEQNNALLTQTDQCGDNALHIAAHGGHLEVVKWIYEQNEALLTEKNHNGFNALHIAALRGDLEIVKFLHEQNKTLLTEKSQDGRNALYIAAIRGHLEVVKWFYEQDKNLLNEKDQDGFNALHIAATQGHLEVVKWLYQIKKTLLTEKTPYGDNPFHRAVYGGQLEVIKWLYQIKKTLLTEKNLNKFNALHLAASEGHLDVTKWIYEQNKSLLREKGQNGYNVLHIAAHSGRLEIVKFLCQQNKTLLMEKTQNGDNALNIATSEGQFEVVEFLVETYPKLLNEENNNNESQFISMRINNNTELGNLIIKESQKQPNKLVSNTKASLTVAPNSVFLKNNQAHKDKKSSRKKDGEFYERSDFEGVSNVKLKEMYEKNLGQNELGPSNPKREQMIAHLLNKKKAPPSVSGNGNITSPKANDNKGKEEATIKPVLANLSPSMIIEGPLEDSLKPENKMPEKTDGFFSSTLIKADKFPDEKTNLTLAEPHNEDQKSKKTKTFRNPIKAATDYMKSKVQSREEKEIEKRKRNKIKVQSKDELSEKSHSTKSTKDTSSMSESYLCITDSQSEWEKSLVSQSEGPLDEITEQVKICYPQFYKLIKKSKAQFLSQVKLNSSLDIRITLKWLKQNGFIDGTIKLNKIHVNKTGNKDCVFISHTTHGAGTHSKWYHDPAVVVSFLAFVANCDPLLRDYLISQFGVHCFSRELDNEDEKFNISLKKDSEKFGDDAREEGEG